MFTTDKVLSIILLLHQPIRSVQALVKENGGDSKCERRSFPQDTLVYQAAPGINGKAYSVPRADLNMDKGDGWSRGREKAGMKENGEMG